MTGRLYRRIAMAMALTIAALGFGLIVRSAFGGAGTTGYVLGALFVALGSGRLYLLRRRG